MDLKMHIAQDLLSFKFIHAEEIRLSKEVLIILTGDCHYSAIITTVNNLKFLQ